MTKGLMKNKGYMTLMTAQAISSMGDWLSIIAVITLVGLKWEGTPLQMSMIILSLALPMALFGPFSGAVADRLERKTLMIISDVFRGVLILLLTIANTVWLVYITLFLVGIFSSVFVPAKNGKLKELVGEGSIKGAMSFTSMIDSSTKIIGPLLSGILVTSFGAYQVFIIDSASFFLSAILILFLPKGERANKNVSTTTESSFRKELAEGFQFIKSSAFLLSGLFLLTISLLIVQLTDSQIIVLLRELTSASPDLFGYAVTCSGLGMLLTGIVLTKKTDYNSFVYMVIGVFGIGFSFGSLAVFTYYDVELNILWVPFFALIAGLASGLGFIPFQAAVQTETPVHMTGRVFGVINSMTTIATIAGPLLGGLLATLIGVIEAFIITSSFLIVLSLIAFLLKNKLERRGPVVTESKQRA
ncbi:MFS transporter [Bacillus seohaeanensis]|jgi:MFS family permease|uniref:MFS transporter n=1 Tax=Bacillus seohaeanensis TaxID=284580 RepID=A0ABW5RUW7_9BACI